MEQEEMYNTSFLLVIKIIKGLSRGRKDFRNIDIDVDLEDNIKIDLKDGNFMKIFSFLSVKQDGPITWFCEYGNET
jgi:hypothetical protein